jgi:hypothetical protein
MNITNEQAEALLTLPKKIIRENVKLSQIIINQNYPFNECFKLQSESEDEFYFLWSITQSSKKALRLSLHFQEDDSKIGLIRIDYNGGHKNPEVINEYVPAKFHSYVGMQLTQSHIHYYVQSYKSLVWAIPLMDDDFKIKSIDAINFNTTLVDIIDLFAKKINVETSIIINK